MKLGLFKFLTITVILSLLISVNLDFLLQKALTRLLSYPYTESFLVLFFMITFFPMILFSFEKVKEKKINIDEIPEKIKDLSSKLNNIYSSELKKLSNSIKTSSLLLKFLIILEITLFIFEIIFLFVTKELRYISWIFLALCFLIIPIIQSKKYSFEENYNKLYKEKIITSFLEQAYPQFNYLYDIDEEKRNSLKNEYLYTEFDNISIQHFYINDFFEGYIDKNIYIRSANLTLKNRATKYSYITIFNGLFVYSNLSKITNTSFKISLNRNFITNSKKYLEMDSNSFENYFDIYTENKFATMKILTHDVMEQLINFYEKYNIPFEIILKNNKLYLRFFVKDLFIPSKIGAEINSNELFEINYILQFIIDVTTKINTILNEKDI